MASPPPSPATGVTRTSQLIAADVSTTAAAAATQQPLDAIFCNGCKRVLDERGGDAVVVSFGNALWHVDCFRCAKCQSLVEHDTNLLLLSDGSPVCQACAYICSVCHRPISNEAIVTGDESYHADCFRCRTCANRIEELIFAKTSQGIYCMNCHNDRVTRSRRHAEAKRNRTLKKDPKDPKSHIKDRLEKESVSNSTSLASMSTMPSSSLDPSASTPSKSQSELLVTKSPNEDDDRTSAFVASQYAIQSSHQSQPQLHSPVSPPPITSAGISGAFLSPVPNSATDAHVVQARQESVDSTPGRDRLRRTSVDSLHSSSPRKGRDRRATSFDAAAAALMSGLGDVSETIHTSSIPLQLPPPVVPLKIASGPNRTLRQVGIGSNKPGQLQLAGRTKSGSTSSERPLPSPPPRESSTGQVQAFRKRDGSVDWKMPSQAGEAPRSGSPSPTPLARSGPSSDRVPSPLGRAYDSSPAALNNSGLGDDSTGGTKFLGSGIVNGGIASGGKANRRSAMYGGQIQATIVTELNQRGLIEEEEVQPIMPEIRRRGSSSTAVPTTKTSTSEEVDDKTLLLTPPPPPLRSVRSKQLMPSPGHGDRPMSFYDPDTLSLLDSSSSPHARGLMLNKSPPRRGISSSKNTPTSSSPLAISTLDSGNELAPPPPSHDYVSGTWTSPDLEPTEQLAEPAQTPRGGGDTENGQVEEGDGIAAAEVRRRVRQTMVSSNSTTTTTMGMDVSLVESLLAELDTTKNKMKTLQSQYNNIKRASRSALEGFTLARGDYDREVAAREDAEVQMAQLKSQMLAQATKLAAVETFQDLEDESLQLRRSVDGLHKTLSVLTAERDMKVAEFESLQKLGVGSNNEAVAIKNLTTRLESIKQTYKQSIDDLISQRNLLQKEIEQMQKVRDAQVYEFEHLTKTSDVLAIKNAEAQRRLDEARVWLANTNHQNAPLPVVQTRGKLSLNHPHHAMTAPSGYSYHTAGTPPLPPDPQPESQEVVVATSRKFKWGKSTSSNNNHNHNHQQSKQSPVTSAVSRAVNLANATLSPNGTTSGGGGSSYGAMMMMMQSSSTQTSGGGTNMMAHKSSSSLSEASNLSSSSTAVGHVNSNTTFATSTSTNGSGSNGMTSLKPHQFQPVSVLRPVRCESCGDKLWGLAEVRCSGCGSYCHSKCVTNFYGCSAGNVSMTTPVDENETDSISGSSMFGNDLISQTRSEGGSIPIIVTKCIEAVDQNGLLFEGIYRKTGGMSSVKMVQACFDRNVPFDLNDEDKFCDVSAITSAFKNYFRQLPNPLFTFELHESFISASCLPQENARIEALERVVYQLPTVHFQTLFALMKHLNRIHHNSHENKMTPQNLGVVLGPTLLRSSNLARSFSDMPYTAKIVELMVEHCEVIFRKPFGGAVGGNGLLGTAS